MLSRLSDMPPLILYNAGKIGSTPPSDIDFYIDTRIPPHISTDPFKARQKCTDTVKYAKLLV